MGQSILYQLGLNRQTNILFLPFSEGLLTWCRGRFKKHAQRRSVNAFLEEELEMYQARTANATAVVVQATRVKAKCDLTSTQVAEIVLTGQDFEIDQYIIGAADARMGDILAYGMVGLISEPTDRALQTRPLTRDRVLWTVDFRAGEIFAMVTIERNAPTLGDEPSHSNAAARTSNA